MNPFDAAWDLYLEKVYHNEVTPMQHAQLKAAFAAGGLQMAVEIERAPSVPKLRKVLDQHLAFCEEARVGLCVETQKPEGN